MSHDVRRIPTNSSSEVCCCCCIIVVDVGHTNVKVGDAMNTAVPGKYPSSVGRWLARSLVRVGYLVLW